MNSLKAKTTGITIAARAARRSAAKPGSGGARRISPEPRATAGSPPAADRCISRPGV